MALNKEEIYAILDNPLVQQVLLEILDDDINGFDVLMVLIDLVEATDDEISRHLNLKLNTVRKLLYKLYDARLVNYDREKDEETNWYTYTWKPALDKLPGVVKRKAQNMLKRLKEQLVVEEDNMFFYCPKCEIKYIFEEAMDYGFRCPQCGGILKEYNNKRDIKILKDQIKFLEDELQLNHPFFSTETGKSKNRKNTKIIA